MMTRFILSNQFKTRLLSPVALVVLAAQMGCDNEAPAQFVAKAEPAQALTESPTLAQAVRDLPAASASVHQDSEHPASSERAVLNAGQKAVSIRFDARVGDKEFDCAQTYDDFGSGDSSIKPRDFRFFVHNLRLINDQGEEVEVAMDDRALWQSQGVALLDFEDGRGGCEMSGDAATNSIVTGVVPEGNYEGLRFTLGVPSSRNHDDPLTLDAPFQSPGMAWSWLFGFKFARIELSTIRGSEGDVVKNGVFHLGSTACSEDNGVYQCEKSNRPEVDLPSFRLDGGIVVADLGALFADSDLSSDQVCHSGSDACNPFFERVGVDPSSGDPASGQQFFSTAQSPGGPAPLTGGSGLVLLGLGLLSMTRRRRSAL